MFKGQIIRSSDLTEKNQEMALYYQIKENIRQKTHQRYKI